MYKMTVSEKIQMNDDLFMKELNFTHNKCIPIIKVEQMYDVLRNCICMSLSKYQNEDKENVL